MSKYQIYPVRIEIFGLFLKENGFLVTTMNIDYDMWENEGRAVMIPKEATLTKTKTKGLLIESGLKYKDFDHFLLTHNNDFDRLLLKKSKLK